MCCIYVYVTRTQHQAAWRSLTLGRVHCAQKLAEDDGTTFYDSAWADTKALKQHFSGVHSVRLG